MSNLQDKAIYCNIISDHLYKVFHKSPSDFETCEYPLVCSCSLNNTLTNSTNDTNTLQIHPRLFDETLSLHTLPFIEQTSTTTAEIINHGLQRIAKGSYGNIWSLPYTIDNTNYIVKLQEIKPHARKLVNSWTAPLVEFESSTNTYITYDFITEALALYVLNRQEEEYGKSFIPNEAGQRRCIPRLYYSTIINYAGSYYSALVMERIDDMVNLYGLLHVYSDKDKTTILQRIADGFKIIEEGPIKFQNQDCHGGNLLFHKPLTNMSAATVNLIMLDFGACMLSIPSDYFCVLTPMPTMCKGSGVVAIKTARTVPYSLNEKVPNSNPTKLRKLDGITYDDCYNFTCIVIGLLYNYTTLYPFPQATNVPVINYLLDVWNDKLQLPAMSLHRAKKYYSLLFEMNLLEYNTDEPTVCQASNNCAYSSSILEKHNSILIAEDPDIITPITFLHKNNLYPNVKTSLIEELLQSAMFLVETAMDQNRNLNEADITGLIKSFHKLRQFVLLCMNERSIFFSINHEHSMKETGLTISEEDWQLLFEQIDSFYFDITDESAYINFYTNILNVPLANINKVLKNLRHNFGQVYNDVMRVHYWLSQTSQLQFEDKGQDKSCIIL